jgi:nucleotidyltransferase substrate binding protein (TIGR01987 family)
MKKNTMDEKEILVFKQLEKALQQLAKVIKPPVELEKEKYIKETAADLMIKRFEFSFEHFRRVLKMLLLHYGEINVNTPKEIFQEAYTAEFIDDEEVWVLMLKDRNRTSHTYHEELAHEICERIPNYLVVMQKTYGKLAQKLQMQSST